MSKIITEYSNLKKSSPESLLIYRLGGFYELYFQDAILAAKELGIILNYKKISSQQIPTCGFPVHSLKIFAHKLLQSGLKINIAEQFFDPENPKKINRQISKILTPGTYVDDEFLSEQGNVLGNIILAIVQKNQKLDLCFGNILLGDFYVDEIEPSQINQYLEAIKPTEILCNDKKIIDEKFHFLITFFQPNADFKFDNQTFKILSDHQNLALQNIFSYIDSIHSQSAFWHFKIHQYQSPKYLKIDGQTVNNLDLKKIIKIIDRTNCQIGKRFFHSAILKPLAQEPKINNRLEGVGFLIAENNFLQELKNNLENLGDLEKIMGKMFLTKNSNINDLALILQDLQLIVKINEILFWQNNSKKIPIIFGEISKKLFANFGLINFLNSALQAIEIKAGFNPRLDNYKKLQREIFQKINQIEFEYQTKSQIKNLKIELNSLGFYFEIKRSIASKINIPDDWELLQNLNNSIRFSSAKLKNLQLENSDLETKIKILEKQILQDCVKKILEYFGEIKTSCKAIGALDLLVSFAILAKEKNYIKPKITNQNLIKIIRGKHFVSDQFIGNDCVLNDNKIWLITGANMAGKSTFLRQNALLVLLAQAGCFLPAALAEIGVRKQIFSKIIIRDDLFKNQSGFKTEMLQIAEIIKNADNNSLIIIDELCQTTNASEAIDIAFNIIKYLASRESLALISTHNLDLAKKCQNLQNIICKKISKNHMIENGVANNAGAIEIVQEVGLDFLINN